MNIASSQQGQGVVFVIPAAGLIPLGLRGSVRSASLDRGRLTNAGKDVYYNGMVDLRARVIREYNQRIYLGLAAAAAIIGLLLFSALVFSFLQFQDSIIYPQSTVESSHYLSSLPSLILQQRVSLRTQDSTPQVHFWYSKHHGIGPEQVATGPCSHMFTSHNYYVVTRRISVTICDTRTGRIIYAQQAMVLR